MTARIVVTDANILFSRTMRDYLLYAADWGLIDVHWSQQILDEMSRNLQRKLGISGSDTLRLERLMNEFIEYALVPIDPDAMAAVREVEMDSADRHVLATALSVGADALVTDNVRHFPHGWMRERRVELLDSRAILARLADDHPRTMLAVHEKTVHYSPKQDDEVLATVDRIVGGRATNPIRRLR